MIRKHVFALALGAGTVLGLGAIGALYAQQPQGGMPGMSMDSTMVGCPTMSAMAAGPAAALEQRQELGLSADQVDRLEALGKQSADAGGAAMAQMKAVHDQAKAATGGDELDEAAARAAFRRMGELHADMAVAMLKARADTRAVLTPEQRTRLEALGAKGMGMMRGMMGGGMMKGGMGMGGMMGMMGHMGGCPMMGGTDRPDSGGAAAQHQNH